jgi:hypothetical protein
MELTGSDMPWIAMGERSGLLTRIAMERVLADEILIAFLGLAWPIRLDAKGDTQIVFPEES